MFGDSGSLAGLIRQFGQLKENMTDMPEELVKCRCEADAVAGLVEPIVDGRGELTNINIDPRALEDVELLEAVGLATRKAQEDAKTRMTKLAGRFDIPGLEELLTGAA